MRRGEVGVVDGAIAGAVRGEDPQARGAQPRDDGRHGHTRDDRQVEQRAGRRADDLGGVRVDAAVADDDGVGPGGVRGADHRAGVAGVTDVREDADDPRPRGEDLVEVGRRDAADGQQALRGLRVGHRRENVGGDVVDRPTGVGRGGDDVGIPVCRLVRDVEVTDEVGPPAHGLADGLRALGEEQSLTGADRPLGQRADRAHALGPGAIC